MMSRLFRISVWGVGVGRGDKSFDGKASHSTKSFISQVALVSAATVTNPCPNEYWEPVLDDNGVQVVNEGSIVCAPIPEAYKITCSPTGIELDIKYELMYDQVLDEQREEIGESLKIEPAKLGNCLNQADQEETSLDYRFQLRYDEKNENGDYCYVSVFYI